MCRFVSKSDSENAIKIRGFLTELQTEIYWLLFVAHRVFSSVEFRLFVRYLIVVIIVAVVSVMT